MGASYPDVVGPREAVVELASLAAHAGVEVRIDAFQHALAGKGGLCRIDGRYVILVDAKLGASEQAGVIGLSLGRFLRARSIPVDIPPRLRSYLRTGHAELRPLVYPRPLARTAPLRLVRA